MPMRMYSLGVLSICVGCVVGQASGSRDDDDASGHGDSHDDAAGGDDDDENNGDPGDIPDPYMPPNPCIEAGTCPAGEWVEVTPSEISMDGNYACNECNYGAQEVVADPVRKNDLYASFCYHGIWKSTDYGLTWEKVSIGTNSDKIDGGRPWALEIDPDEFRDQNTPPTLYTVSGYGGNDGVYKSTDGGVNWTISRPENESGPNVSSDVYSIAIDPYDSSHLIIGFHGFGLSESYDAGETWADVPVPPLFGTSVFVWFIEMGDERTSGTWLSMAEWNSNNRGMWRTEDFGATWDHVLPTLEHGHGASQIYQNGSAIYAAGAGIGGSIWRSNDYGETWDSVSSSRPQNAVFGTPNYVYATLPGAFLFGQSQHLQRSPVSDGIHWVDWAPTAPDGMTNGAKRAAVTYDGASYIIVTANWNAGLWRYVEE